MTSSAPSRSRRPTRAMDVMLNRWLLYQTLACRIVGALGLLPGERRLWIPRPAPGWDGDGGLPAGARPRASPAGRRPAIRRGRCSALVAAPCRPGRAHADLRRSRLAALCGRPLHRGHRRSRRLRRDAFRFSKGPCCGRASTSPSSSPWWPMRRPRCSSIARSALDRSLANRRARPAADGDGRLERRHEPGGNRGQGRERVARLVPLRHAPGLRTFGRSARRARPARRHGASMRRRCKDSVEREAWDGDWYRRGYFDDGTPLGSASSSECRIDSIAQSWGVISGAADPDRARRAMASAERPAHRPRRTA